MVVFWLSSSKCKEAAIGLEGCFSDTLDESSCCLQTGSKFPCDQQCRSTSSWPGEDAGPAVEDSLTPGPDQLGSRAPLGPGQSLPVAVVPRQMLLGTQVTSSLTEKGGAISLWGMNPKERNHTSCIYCGPETDTNVVFSPPLAFILWFFLIVFLNIW